ncbi:MAG TPA: hypothetical protein VFD90_08520 [Gaiellales bacterium]|jgi:hypothetical protein|nr:hypothetical protein [Gaiellales bacterium]
MASDRPPPLDLRPEDAIDLGYATDFHILLRAIDEAMPEDAILVLEGDATAPAVAAFLREHEAADRRELVPNSPGKVQVFHLPLAHGNLSRLRLQVAEGCASPEIAFHLAVYREDEVLLWAHDAGDGSVLLALSLPDETIERFRAALGATLRPYVRYRWFGLRRVRD